MSASEAVSAFPLERLNSRTLARRWCIKDEGQSSRLLSRLERLGLVANTRMAQRRDDVKAWQLVTARDNLDPAIRYESPAWSQSVALDLMRASGGRLSERDLSVLRVIGVEPGLTNNDVAPARAGIVDENAMSQLLARLSKRGLVENIRSGGRHNVPRLTPTADNPDGAIWHETPPAVQRKLALDLLRDRGGRLNHRTVSVLRVIAAEPGLGNTEIAERLGVNAKSDTSRLLARLAQRGPIENTVDAALPFEANVWQLTASGRELEAAIRNQAGRGK
jgi:DNA-binding MarR family transcriptional regulator